MSQIERIFLDTSFFIRLLDNQDEHHANAVGYYQRWIADGTSLFSSTIVMAEFGVQADLGNFPARGLTTLAFDASHAAQTAIFAKAAFAARRKGIISLDHRNVIPNDTKLIAQAHTVGAEYLAGRDQNLKAVLHFLQQQGLTSVQYLDITTPAAEFFGELF
ncbi:MAG: type II toxin-antitoxin system VapC family toxin [Bacteroidota bacterium]